MSYSTIPFKLNHWKDIHLSISSQDHVEEILFSTFVLENYHNFLEKLIQKKFTINLIIN